MNPQYEIVGDYCVCNIFPPEWVGSSIQASVLLADFDTQELAQAAALEAAEKIYSEV